jgi:ABC-type nitrate/sulfonate/bicarbonate transport system ATPase subunit
MIQLQSISFAYPHGVEIFQDFDWQVKRGESWAVLGASGCGKTTLLYLLAGLRFPCAGKISIEGQEIVRPRPRTGLILQDYGLLPWANIGQNAGLGMQVRSFYGPDGKHAPVDFRPTENAAYWLERLGIADLRDKYPGQISGGQRQRTAIARTLALNPDLLLMDEPFSSLDAPTRESLHSLTLELQTEQNLTLLIVTHAIEEALSLGRRILLLGRPPNRQAVILENPEAGEPGYGNSPRFLSLGQELRSRLEVA